MAKITAVPEIVTKILEREICRVDFISKERPLDIGEVERLNLLAETFMLLEPKNPTARAARKRGMFIKDDEEDMLKYAQPLAPKVK